MRNREAGMDNEPQRHMAVASAVLSGFFGRVVDALRTAHATALTRTRKSVDGSWLRLNLSIASRRFAFVMRVCATQERYLIQHVLLEPFEPEIDDRRHKQRNQLGENQAAYDHQTERAARCSVLAESERDGDCAHKRGKRCHH